MRMKNFGCLNSPLSLFLFSKKPVKKNYGVHTLTAEPSPSPHKSKYDFN